MNKPNVMQITTTTKAAGEQAPITFTSREQAIQHLQKHGIVRSIARSVTKDALVRQVALSENDTTFVIEPVTGAPVAAVAVSSAQIEVPAAPAKTEAEKIAEVQAQYKSPYPFPIGIPKL